MDDDTRARLRVRLYADPALADRVLPREAQDRALVEAARTGETVAAAHRPRAGHFRKLAPEILDDESGQALAVAAKALGLNRAAFSGLALLVQPQRRYRRLLSKAGRLRCNLGGGSLARTAGAGAVRPSTRLNYACTSCRSRVFSNFTLGNFSAT